MSGPRFSIVIPTRSRHRTLPFTLRTCLDAAVDEVEVLVSDNFSTPETREVVQSFDDVRLRYVRTPAPLSFTDSIEFAVDASAGDYVIVLGDDDALLRHALPTLAAALKETGTRAICWDGAAYNWPDLAPQSYAAPSTLMFPLKQRQGTHALERREAGPWIRAVANARAAYSELPVPFTAAIHREAFAALRARTGRVFKSRTPDVYAAIGVAHILGVYHHLDAPLSISGLSGSSTGIARHFQRRGSPIEADFRRRNEAAGHLLYPEVPDLPPIASAVADSFLHAKEALRLDDSYALDRRAVILACLNELVVESPSDWTEGLAECRRSLLGDPALTAWFDAEVAGKPAPESANRVRKQAYRRYGGQYLAVDAAELGAFDVHAAAIVCEKLLGYARDGLSFRVQDQPGESAGALSELQEKEAMIQGLKRSAEDRQRLIEELLGRLRELESPRVLLRAMARGLARKVSAALGRR